MSDLVLVTGASGFLASQFYNSVTTALETEAAENLTTVPDITLTGHSLGSGLAGLANRHEAGALSRSH